MDSIKRRFGGSSRFMDRVKKINFINVLVYIALALISYQFLYPLLRMLTLSFMGVTDLLNPAVNWVPRNWSLSNMRAALRVMNLTTTMLNSMRFAGTLALSQTLVSALTGYALARFDVRFKQFWFMLIIITFILPVPVLLIPRIIMLVTFAEMTGITLLGTMWPQTLLAMLGQGMFSAILILIFYNFTRMIPPALDEAASIDGASALQVFYHIILKLSVTTLLVIFLLSFVWNWNETYITGVFMRGAMDLVTTRLEDFNSLFGQFAGEFVEADLEEVRLNEAYRMAGTLVSITPLFVLYLIVQRQFIKGIENTGLTGL